MARVVLGVIAGSVTWLMVWTGVEKVIMAVSPVFAAHQAGFQAAIENGNEFTANPAILGGHIILGSGVSLISGFLASLIAGDNRRAPLILGFLLIAMGSLKAVMSWELVPVWYHVGFAAMLPLMAIIGGKMKTIS